MALIALDKFLPIPTGMRSFTLKDDDVFYDCSEALSFGFFSLGISAGRSYRNELDAGYIGRNWFLLVGGVGTSGGFLTTWGQQGSIASDPDPPIQTLDVISAADDRFNATPPFDDPLMTSWMAFMTEVDGTGNCVALCKAIDFNQFSHLPPTRY